MKLILIPHLPKFATRGYQLSKNLAKKNEVHFILWDMPYPLSLSNLWDNLRNSFRYKEYKKENITIHKIRRFPFFLPLVNKWLFKKQINKIFEKFKIDIIISETYFNETEPPLNLPLVYDLVDDHIAMAEIYGSKLYKIAFKFLQVKKTIETQIKESKEVIVVSNELIKFIKKYNKKVCHIPNGTPSSFLKKFKIDMKENFGKYSIVYVSNFDKFSNLPNVIFAINDLKRKYKDIKLILVGTGIQILEAKKLVNKLQLKKNVKFLGWVNHDKVKKIIKGCQIALMPFEKNKLTDSAFPIKIIEYLALDKKIVSSNLEEIKLLKCPNIFIYKDNKNHINLAKSIDMAFSKKLICGINRKIAKNYTWDKINDNLEKLLKGVIKK